MARRDSVTARQATGQPLKPPRRRGESPQGVPQEQQLKPLRRSVRLTDIHETEQKARQQPLPSPVSDVNRINSAHIPPKPPKRKREPEQQPDPPSSKRQREAGTRLSVHDLDSITHWTRTNHWPRGHFKESVEMKHLFARKKSTSSSRRKRSDSESNAPSSTTPSDQKPREQKSAPYQDPRYTSLLEAGGCFMRKYVGRSEEGPTAESKKECKSLLEAEQTVAKDSLFEDDFFENTCEMIRERNEAKIIQDIARLIVPSAQSLAIRGATHLRCLVESVNEGWNNSIPLTTPRPQPDYAVGFNKYVFTEEQLKKLLPYVGELTDTSFFMGTWYMYFPFFSSEVKCGAAALNVADRQNAHSMTLAVRGVVNLFALVKREKELHRQILAFSISHDNRIVRIYGHYPVIEGKKTTFYCHLIREFSITELDGKDRWSAYKFTKSVYDTWMPAHFKRLCSAIDAIPSDLQFELSEESVLQFPSSTRLSRGESQHFSGSGATDHDELGALETRDMTSDTSITQKSAPMNFKKPKKR